MGSNTSTHKSLLENDGYTKNEAIAHIFNKKKHAKFTVYSRLPMEKYIPFDCNTVVKKKGNMHVMDIIKIVIQIKNKLEITPKLSKPMVLHNILVDNNQCHIPEINNNHLLYPYIKTIVDSYRNDITDCNILAINKLIIQDIAVSI